MSGTIDLRSDTVTRPSPAMREAMAGADVGDDVLDGDPTLAALQARVADLLGVEAALWTPTGCMANTVALMHHLTRGDRFLAPAGRARARGRARDLGVARRRAARCRSSTTAGPGARHRPR